MTVPPIYNLHELGPQAQMMAKNCNNDRLAMILSGTPDIRFFTNSDQRFLGQF